ncbi:MAG: N-acetyltransferase [Desulfobacterales bacterium]|jgi:amino-acid N-acetyltransferase
MIHRAAIGDVKSIHRLLQFYGNRGELLPRPLSKLYDHVRDFFVYREKAGGALLGCCALQFCWEDLAEIRSLAVSPEHVNRGIGRRLTGAAIEEARAFGVRQVFTLTYRPDFFRRFGFHQIDRTDLPLKIWSDCMLCVKFPDCDETAMMLTL